MTPREERDARRLVLRLRDISLGVARVLERHRGRDEAVDGLVDELRRPVTEKRLRPWVREHDQATGIDHQQRVRCHRDQRFVQLLVIHPNAHYAE